jgi:putative serine protease PepD
MTRRSSLRPSPLVALAVLLVAGALLTLLFHGQAAGPPIAAPPPGLSLGAGFAPVVARALPSVVQIRSSRGLGSGVVLDAAGHVVTNAHVVAGARSFRVTLADGSQDSATLRGAFVQGDLAVVQLHAARPRAATFADSSSVRVGDYALAIGNPLGLRSSVTQGVVSSTSRTVPEGGGVALPAVIQTSAPINPGNSGGALVDSKGAVIGIPTLAATDPELGGAADGIGFAIASNTARSIAGQLVAHGRVLHTPGARGSVSSCARSRGKASSWPERRRPDLLRGPACAPGTSSCASRGAPPPRSTMSPLRSWHSARGIRSRSGRAAPAERDP